MRAYERLLKYVQFDTASNEANDCCPSTPGQLVLARALADELLGMGVADAHVDANGYVYASVPANAPGQPTIGLVAHMDTVDSVPVLPMNPRIVENYDGGPVTLDNGDVLDPAVFPDVARAKGKSLIVTDGRTLLGADDKAGVAEIMTCVERLLDDPTIRHGRVVIAFTPDEEIGRGADRFDIEGFGADFAYTIDGDVVGSIEYECFNAASARVTLRGVSVHPGTAKNRMRNAALLAVEFASMLPPAETPAHTEGYEGFYHLCGMKAEEDRGEMQYIIRDHDRTRFEARKAAIARVADYMNAKYGAEVVSLTLRDTYSNMREIVEKCPECLERARRAYRAAGVEPWSKPIRGGTDGAVLSFKGLPCPNLGTGGMNYHGRFEYITIEDMDTMTDVLVKLVSV